MLSEAIEKLEQENAKLKELLKRTYENTPKPKQCDYCKHYIRHYGKKRDGSYYRIYTGHCICGVPTSKRKGKKEPTPEDTCLCFELVDHES